MISIYDNTGKRTVNSIFIRPGDKPYNELDAALDPELEKSTAKNEYNPNPVQLDLALSTDKTMRLALDIAVQVRDGKKLLTDFYYPPKDGKYPVILERTPENRKKDRFSKKLGPLFAKAGFIFAVQNVRGLFGSEGDFFPFRDEGNDGKDTHLWVSRQPWSNEIIGAIGKDYSAYAACLSAAGSKYLKALVLENCPSDLFMNGGLYLDGVPMTGCLYSEVMWQLPSILNSLRWDDALFHLPLNEMDDILGYHLPFWDECLRHPSYNYFWESLSIAGLYKDIDVAALHIGGWYNHQDLGAVSSNYVALSEMDMLRGRSGRQSLLIGPWSQEINSESSLGFSDFTEICIVDDDALYTAWFNKWLLQEPSLSKGQLPEPVKVFILGANEWIDLPSWPLVDQVSNEPYFLHSEGDASEDWDLGTLSLDPPSGFEEIDSFISDPANPVLSEIEFCTDDQRPVEQRKDVLSYTTSLLEDDLTIIGAPQVVLHVNALTPDMDLFAMLTDVDEFGFSRPVAFGVTRARFRDSFQTPSPISPAEINTYIIDLTPVANRFLKGHSIRLNVMGSYFPFLTRNLNTGFDIGADTLGTESAVFLLHDIDYPSRIMLPVMTKGD